MAFLISLIQDLAFCFDVENSNKVLPLQKICKRQMALIQLWNTSRVNAMLCMPKVTYVVMSSKGNIGTDISTYKQQRDG